MDFWQFAACPAAIARLIQAWAIGINDVPRQEVALSRVAFARPSRRSWAAAIRDLTARVSISFATRTF